MAFLAIIVLVILALLAVKTLRLDRIIEGRPRRTRHDTSAWGSRNRTPPADEE